MLVGDDARQLMELIREPVPPEFEAHVVADDSESAIFFEFYDVGYVALDDWKDIDADAMLASIKESTEEVNATRKDDVTFGPIHVTGWLQEPTLDRATNTVYWAIAAEDGTDSGLVNSVALRLGRHGYEKLIWVTDKPGYVPQGGALDTMMRAHSFNAGSGYADYIPGDKVANFGIATLVGTTTGANLLTAGGLAILIVFLKKFGIFIVAALGAALFKLKGFFSRRAGP